MILFSCISLLVLNVIVSIPDVHAVVGGHYAFSRKWGSYGTGDGEFQYPFGVATDSLGNVYVVDNQNSRIQKFTSTGTFMRSWGIPGQGDGEFVWPVGIAVDYSGNVYVSDAGCRIEKFGSSGTFFRSWGSCGSGDGEFRGAMGVAVDSSGFVYATDADNHRVQKFTNTGTFVTKWGGIYGSGNGQFKNPHGIAVDSLGNVFVADLDNARIQMFQRDGTFIRAWGKHGLGDGEFQDPTGVTLDKFGYLYVTERASRVQKFQIANPCPVDTVQIVSGVCFVTKWGNYGTGDGQFRYPFGIAEGFEGMYVSDAYLHKIQKFYWKTDEGGPTGGGHTDLGTITK